MRTLFQAATAVLLAAGLAYAQTPPQPASQTLSRQWTTLRLPEYGFTVEFPAQATEGRLESGEIRWAVELDNGWTAYIVSTSLLAAERVQSAGAQRVLDDAVKGGLARFPDAVVLDDKTVEIGGNPGREFVIKVTVQDQPLVISSRVILVQRRLYVYTAVAKPSHDQAEVTRFLKSFALISQ